MRVLGGGEHRVLGELQETIERELRRIGLLYRIFGRVKSESSIERKIRNKGYTAAGRKIRDLFGLRIALYFGDDIGHTQKSIERILNRVESTIDAPGADIFGPTRHNLVFKLPEWAKNGCGVNWNSGTVDPTCEIQLRTILSEGWHEVEHDLRYKTSNDWNESLDLSRRLNGILATVENCEWSTIQVFEELARRHYRAKRWDALLRAKLRLRLEADHLSENVFETIQGDLSLQKKLFKMSRIELIERIVDSGADFPFTLDNLCFAANRVGEFSSELRKAETASFEAAMRSCRFVDFTHQSGRSGE